jgi:phage host-nuclease inhibitor protein Gam
MRVHQQVLSVKVSVVDGVMEALKKSGLHLALVTKVGNDELDEIGDFLG